MVVAGQVEVRQRAGQVVALAEVVVAAVERAAHVAVAEAHAHAVVVAVEVADERFDGGHRTVGADAVHDEHDVRVVARERAVGGRETHDDLALVGELEFVDLPVDAPARREEMLPAAALRAAAGYGGCRGLPAEGVRARRIGGEALRGRCGGRQRDACRKCGEYEVFHVRRGIRGRKPCPGRSRRY